ncbi:MAG: hypothetical protein AAFX52_09490 [Pseudomonadota bacterium]
MQTTPPMSGTQTVSIASRFCGPKQSGNGGYVAGLLAKSIDGPAEIRLRAKPPLERLLTIASDGDEAALLDGDMIVATARRASFTVNVPEAPSKEALDEARLAYQSYSHVLPHCFVCGPKRAPNDGLRIFAGPVDGTSVNADFWTPDASLGDGTGLVASEFLWAALDCPSAFSLRLTDQFILLGSLAADIRRRPKVGEPLIAMGWPREQPDGRKRPASSALMTLDGEVIAVANSIWIDLNDEALIRVLKEQNQ